MELSPFGGEDDRKKSKSPHGVFFAMLGVFNFFVIIGFIEQKGSGNGPIGMYSAGSRVLAARGCCWFTGHLTTLY